MLTNTDKNINFPNIKAVFQSFTLLLDNMRKFATIGSIFSMVIILLFWAFGQGLVCENATMSRYMFCSENFVLMIVSFMLFWIVCCSFIRVWTQTVIYEKAKFSYKMILPKFTDLKILGVIAVLLAIFFIALVSAYFLIMRIPNPNWVIELLYFTAVSTGFLAPVIAAQFVLYVSFVANEDKLPKIKDVWLANKGIKLPVFIGFSTVMLVCFMITTSLLRYLTEVATVGNWFVAIIVEFLYTMVMFAIVAIYANYSSMQRKFLFERNSNAE